MSTWDDITGKTARRQAQNYYDKAQSEQQMANNILSGNYSRLLGLSNGIMQGLAGLIGQNKDSYNEFSGTARDANKQALDVLTGKVVTPEQQQASELILNYIDQLTGKNKTAEQQQADQWSQNYLNLLQGSPDTAFNAGVTNLAKNLESQKKAVANQMQNRGISGSGIDLDKIAGTQNDYYAGMSQLQAQRLNNQLNTSKLGADYSQGIADRVSQNYGQGVKLADAFAHDKLNNLVYGANMAQNLKGNSMQNLVNLYGQYGNAGNLATAAGNAVAGQYNTAANNNTSMGNSYAQAAGNAAGALGGLAGTLIGGLINPIGAAIGGNIGKKLGGN